VKTKSFWSSQCGQTTFNGWGFSITHFYSNQNFLVAIERGGMSYVFQRTAFQLNAINYPFVVIKKIWLPYLVPIEIFFGCRKV
jgi:hypothetical protein